LAQKFYKKVTIIFKPMKTLADRLNEFKKKNRITWEGFAEKLGEKHSTLMAYATGKRQPKGEFYTNFEKVYGFDIGQYEDKSGTNVLHEPANKYDAGNMYRQFFEEQTDYLVIPKIMFEDYEIVPKAEQDAKRQMYLNTIEQHNEYIELAKKNLEDLRRALESGRSLRKQNVQ
jgi:transcriptional regulator with XRE-family HTH domain